MRKVFSIIIVITSAVISISAQTKLERRHHSEVINTASKTDTSVSEVGNGAFYPRTSYNYPLEDFKPGVVRVGPRTTYLKDGLRIDEVIRLLGKPISITQRTEQNVSFKIYVFQRGEGQVLIAEFENGLLVRSCTEWREAQPTQADR